MCYLVYRRVKSKFTVRPGGVSLFLKYAKAICVSRDLNLVLQMLAPSACSYDLARKQYTA